MIYYKIGKLIKEDGRSYRELANKIGISYRTFALLAKAKTHADIVISTVILNKLCRFFKCKVNDLIEYSEK